MSFKNVYKTNIMAIRDLLCAHICVCVCRCTCMHKHVHEYVCLQVNIYIYMCGKMCEFAYAHECV